MANFVQKLNEDKRRADLAATIAESPEIREYNVVRTNRAKPFTTFGVISRSSLGHSSSRISAWSYFISGCA